MEILASGLDDAYRCVAVVYQIPDEFDCIRGIPFFEDMQPQIDRRSRRIEGTRTKTLYWKRAGETGKPIEEGGPVIASGLRRSVEAKGLSAKRPDSCRGAALETDVKLTVEAVGDAVQKEKTPSVVLKFLRIKTKKIDEPDFMLVLLNETIKQVARSLQRRDEPDNVGSAKAQSYLETDWDTFRENPAFDLLTEYKDTVFRPELPDGLPAKRELEHRIDVKDPNLAMSFDDTSFSSTISEVTGDSELVARIKKSYKKDRDAQAILTAIKRRKSDSRPKREQQQHKNYRCYSEATGLLWYQTPVDDAPRIVVPNDVKLRQTIISECHDTNYGGHPGAERT
ncbi:uncharacterized protein IUM83_11906 [Phytophthora cinnamomi]|uniref:uncharacterized protein n=1 Tax=Phytophthora cinnamomi TaxID=4785 RepID=UPI00355A7AE0|nr:hypothetical protein IUM83_11906 [Phytophthora cinnamomi]